MESDRSDQILTMSNGREARTNDGRSDISNWLPITASRTAKWYYSAFHNVTAMVGAGVLGLPYTLIYLGWGPGVVVLTLSWVITLYTLWQMVELHEAPNGKRFDRYHELGQEAFGKKLGFWIVVPQQLIVEIGVNIVYMVTGGQSLQKIYVLFNCDDNLKSKDLIKCEPTCCKSVKLSAWIVIFSSVEFFLSQLPNFNSIAGVSFVAAIMSFSYSTIAWATSLAHGRVGDVNYSIPHTADRVFNMFNSLGIVAFAYAGHNVVLEIQATIPSTPEKPSKTPMWRGVMVAYFVVALCYFPVSLVGYWAFGSTVDEDILIQLNHPKLLIAAANMMVVIHVAGSYQIYAMPVFDMMESVLVKKFGFRPEFRLRLATRTLYVAFTCFVAITIPFFNSLLGFFGGFALAPTSYFLPCIIWLKIKKPKRFSVSWTINWACIILGVLLVLVSSIGSMKSIINHAENYSFYQ